MERWQQGTLLRRTRRRRVPQELAGVCRWAGCWPAKLISHSPGTHNASRVTMGINRRSERGDREREAEILQKKYSRTASVSLGCRFWPWRPAARFGLFINSPHFNTQCKGNTYWITRSQLSSYRKPFGPGHNKPAILHILLSLTSFAVFFPEYYQPCSQWAHWQSKRCVSQSVNADASAVADTAGGWCM